MNKKPYDDSRVHELTQEQPSNDELDTSEELELKKNNKNEDSPPWISKVSEQIRVSRLEDSRSSFDNETIKDRGSPIQVFREAQAVVGSVKGQTVHNKFNQIFNSATQNKPKPAAHQIVKRFPATMKAKNSAIKSTLFKSTSPNKLLGFSSFSNLKFTNDRVKDKLFMKTTDTTTSIASSKMSDKVPSTNISKISKLTSPKQIKAAAEGPIGIVNIRYNFRKNTSMNSFEPQSLVVLKLPAKDMVTSEFEIMKPIYDKPRTSDQISEIIEERYRISANKTESIVDKLRPLNADIQKPDIKSTKRGKQLTFYKTLKALDVKRPYSPQASRTQLFKSPSRNIINTNSLKDNDTSSTIGRETPQKSILSNSIRGNRARLCSEDKTPFSLASEAIEKPYNTFSKAFGHKYGKDVNQKMTQESTIMNNLLQKYEEVKAKHEQKYLMNRKLHENMAKAQEISTELQVQLQNSKDTDEE